MITYKSNMLNINNKMIIKKNNLLKITKINKTNCIMLMKRFNR